MTMKAFWNLYSVELIKLAYKKDFTHAMTHNELCAETTMKGLKEKKVSAFMQLLYDIGYVTIDGVTGSPNNEEFLLRCNNNETRI